MERNNNEDAKPPKPGCCTRFGTSMRNFGRFLYNPDTKQVLGRGGISWLQILVFYTVFYAVLAGFWAACMVVFIKTLDPIQPTMQKMFSMMKDNPGMNFDPFNDTSTTLIYYTPNSSDIAGYIDTLQNVYSTYANLSFTEPNLKDCNNNNTADVYQGCKFEVKDLGPCNPSTNFGYDMGKPCVLLRINRVYLWNPNDVTFSTGDICKGSTSQNCTNRILFDALPSSIKTNLLDGNIAVSCEGESDGDADNILDISYYPPHGFPAYYFPYYNQDGFQSPLVMAQFNVIPGRVSLIWCRIWTKNIVHNLVDLQGSIHLELFVGP